jgi:valyl-tRNA synthetase
MLANKNFVERAPKEVIDQKYERKAKLESEKEKILDHLHMLD